jgi:hypothetical protein
VETVVSPKEVVLESLSYTASEVVGGAGWVKLGAQGCPKAVVCPKAEEWCGRRPKGGVAEVQRPEEIVSRRLVTPGFPPKMLSSQPKEGGVPRRRMPFGGKKWCASRAKEGGVTVATKMWTQQHKIGRKARKNSQKQSTETRIREFIELT